MNFVIVLSVLLGCCALALDVGLLELKQIQLQNAADAAAIGAAYQMEREQTSTSASAIADYKASASAEAGQNGFVNGTNNVTVTTNMPPVSGLYANNLASVQVNVKQTVSSIFRSGSYSIAATAVGVVPPCVYFMSKNPLITTLTIINNTHIHIGCAGYSGWNGFSDAGTVASFDALYVVGPLSASSFNGTVAAGSPGYYPTFNAPVESDPLSYLASPAFSQCDSTHLAQTSIGTAGSPLQGTVQLYPGTYCGGLNIYGLSPSLLTVNFNPGLYIITGGVTWMGATITGKGVMFFMTKGGGYPLTYGYGQFLVGSLLFPTVVTLSAATANSGGALAGVVIFGDRNWSGGTTDFIFNNSTLNMDGIVYTTNTGMSFANGALTSPNYFGLVVDNFTLNNATFTIQGNYSGVAGGSPYRPGVGLSE